MVVQGEFRKVGNDLNSNRSSTPFTVQLHSERGFGLGNSSFGLLHFLGAGSTQRLARLGR